MSTLNDDEVVPEKVFMDLVEIHENALFSINDVSIDLIKEQEHSIVS